MRQRRRTPLSEDGEENFWPSFADVTSTFALILFVLVLLAYAQNLIAGRNLEKLKTELAKNALSLRASRADVRRSEQKLQSLAVEIEAGQAQLRLAEQLVEEQRGIISTSNLELQSVNARLQGIAVLRLDVLTKVKESIEAQLPAASDGRGPMVRIAENGNIVINESLLFEYDSYAVKKSGKRVLETLATAFANVLADDTLRGNIDVIVVQGHSDDRGSSAYNRDLSAKRASAVLGHMFQADPSLEQTYGSYFAASAYSEFRPVAQGTSDAAREQNRRIELSVVLKDATIRQVIDEYMRGIDPALRKDSAPTPP